MYSPCQGCRQQHPETTRERRPNGYTVCGNCGYRTLSRYWDSSDASEIYELEKRVSGLEDLITDMLNTIPPSYLTEDAVYGWDTFQNELNNKYNETTDRR